MGSSLDAISIIGIVFITLKLCGVMTWSWAVILLPFYWYIIVVIGIVALALVFVGIIKILTWLKLY